MPIRMQESKRGFYNQKTKIIAFLHSIQDIGSKCEDSIEMTLYMTISLEWGVKDLFY